MYNYQRGSTTFCRVHDLTVKHNVHITERAREKERERERERARERQRARERKSERDSARETADVRTIDVTPFK